MSASLIEDVVGVLSPPSGERVPTGIVGLDTPCGGLPRGKLTALVAPPSLGCTAFALSVALNVATKGAPALYFSLSLGREPLLRRLLCLHADVATRAVRDRTLPAERFEQIRRQAEELARAPFWLKAQPLQTISEIQVEAINLPDAPALVVVDSLSDVRDGIGRVAELAAAAADTDAAWLVLARTPPLPCSKGRPSVSQLPAELVRHADLALALHRPAYYNANEDLYVGELNVLWNHSGPTGSLPLTWNPQVGRFASC